MFHFPTTRQARVFTLGEPSEATQELWIAFHGYGQLAAYFIKHFESLVGEDCWIIAPEALSRFYLQMGGGRVGASWMTREDRLTEIDDQILYLDQLMAHLKAQIPHQQYKIHVVGFSQGVATAYRWLMQGEHEVDSMIAWAGRMPEEYPEAGMKRFQSMSLFSVIGNQDQFISPEKAEEEVQKMKTYFPHLQASSFEGKHVMDSEILLKIARKLRE